MESISLEDLSRRVSDADSVIKSGIGDLPMRKLLGFDRALQRIQGEFANNVGKLGELDKHIDKEHQKLRDLQNDPAVSQEDKQFSKKSINDRLNSLKDERATRCELASQNRKELQSQVDRIRQTIEKVLDSDTTLAERIRTLFREQGITIALILTAFGLLISTIVGFVTGGGGGGVTGAALPKSGAKKWIQDKLKALARLFGKLAQKLGAALPGIIGSIVSWLLNILKKVTLFAAEYVWLFVAGVVGLIVTILTKQVKTKNN